MQIGNLSKNELRTNLPYSPRRPVAREVDKLLAGSPEDKVADIDYRLSHHAESLHQHGSSMTTGATVSLAAATAVLLHGTLTGGFGAGHALLMGGCAVAAWAMLRSTKADEREATRTEINDRMLMAETRGYLAGQHF